MIFFSCNKVGNFAAKFPNKSNDNSKRKKGFNKFNKQGSKKKFLSKEDSSSSDEDNDSEEEANERVLFMDKQNKPKHNKQEVSNNEEEGWTIDEFYEESIKLIKYLKAEKIRSKHLKDKFKVSKLK